MTPIQIAIIACLAGLASFVGIAGATRKIARPIALLWLVMLLVGILATLDPNRTTVIARGLGIDRGTDLLLYALVLAVLQGFLIFYLRLRKVRRELTILVRRLAILEAPGGSPAPEPTDCTEQP